MLYQYLFLALCTLSCTVHAQTIKPQTKVTSSEQSLKTGTQETSTTMGPVKNAPKEKTEAPSTCNKRRNGIIAGTVSFIGLSVLAIIGFVISCIP